MALNLAVLIPMVRAILNEASAAPRLLMITGAYLVFLLHGFTDYGFQETALTLFVAMLLGGGFAMATNLSSRQMQARAIKPVSETDLTEKQPEERSPEG